MEMTQRILLSLSLSPFSLYLSFSLRLDISLSVSHFRPYNLNHPIFRVPILPIRRTFAGVQSYFTRCPVLPAEWARSRSRQAGGISFCVYVTRTRLGRRVWRREKVRVALIPRDKREMPLATEMFAFVTSKGFCCARHRVIFLIELSNIIFLLYDLRFHIALFSNRKYKVL